MAKESSYSAYPDLFDHFSSNLYEAHEQLMGHWHNPFQYTFDSILHITDLATETIDSITEHHRSTLEFYLGRDKPVPDNQRDQKVAEKQRTETGRVALVTGGIGGIGTEICKRLYNDGHQVIATYISVERDKAESWQQEQFNYGYEIDIIECDVTSFSSCRKMASAIDKQYKRIDILVNCAGITRDATLKKMATENWHAVLDTNLDSVFNVTRNVINKMIKRGYGRIVNISSVNGQKGQFGQTNYATAKAGMIGFTKSLALELADTGITANSVCPGYVGTSMVEAIPEDVKNRIISTIPVGRLANPAEVADAVAFLTTGNAGYITGSELSVNGGLFTGKA